VRDTPVLTDSKRASANAGLRFVARQPIFDRSEKVFGYELQFRDGIEDYFALPTPTLPLAAQ